MKSEGDLLISIYSRHWSPYRLIAYTWDDRGNLLADGTFTYTYSAAGRMVRAESITATLVYTYTSASLSAGNADGLRVARSQSVSSVESVDLFTWDWAAHSAGSGQARVPELLSDGESVYLIGHDTLGWQNGDELAPSEAEGWTFVLPDAGGVVTLARTYEPFGGILEEQGQYETAFGFLGAQLDRSSGLLYANPTFRTFTNE